MSGQTGITPPYRNVHDPEMQQRDDARETIDYTCQRKKVSMEATGYLPNCIYLTTDRAFKWFEEARVGSIARATRCHPGSSCKNPDGAHVLVPKTNNTAS